MWYVDYEYDVITEPKQIEANGYSSIQFENLGNDDALIDGIIPINANSLPRKFENRPGELINDKFRVVFANNSAVKKILVIKTFYKS